MNKLIEKLCHLQETFVGAPKADLRPSHDISWFVSAALLSLDGTPAQVIETAQARQREANDIAKMTAKQHSWLARQNWLLNFVSKITANRDQCQMVGVVCMAEQALERRLVIRMLSSTGSIPVGRKRCERCLGSNKTKQYTHL